MKFWVSGGGGGGLSTIPDHDDLPGLPGTDPHTQYLKVPPASVLNNRVARWDGGTGRLLQTSLVAITDLGAMTGVSTITMTGTPTASGHAIRLTDLESRVPDGTNNYIPAYDGSGLKTRDELHYTATGELTFDYPSPGASNYPHFRLRADKTASSGADLARVCALADDNGGNETEWGSVRFVGTWPGGSGLTEAGAIQFYVRDNDADLKAFEMIGGAYTGGSPFAGTGIAYMYLPFQFSGNGEYLVPSGTSAFKHSTSSAGLFFVVTPFTGYDFRNGSGTTYMSLDLSGSLVLDQVDLDMQAHNIISDTTTGTQIATSGGASGQKLGFFGTTPIVQPLLATGGGATVDNVITALQNLGLVRQT